VTTRRRFAFVTLAATLAWGTNAASALAPIGSAHGISCYAAANANGSGSGVLCGRADGKGLIVAISLAHVAIIRGSGASAKIIYRIPNR
jgi:hypothetical protein